MKVSNKTIEKEAEKRYEQYPNAEVSYHNVHFEEQQDAFIEGCKWIQSKEGVTVNCATVEQLKELKEISLENVKMISELIANKTK